MAEKAIAATITDPKRTAKTMADEDKLKRDLREGKTASDEDEYGKVGDGDDPDGETDRNGPDVQT